MSRITAENLTFGIEIECALPVSLPVIVGGYHSGIQVQGLPDGWEAQADGSIRGFGSAMRGVEIVSPVLKGADGIRQVLFVLETLRSWGAKVNSSTGLHIHVGFDRSDGKSLARLVNLMARHEKAFFASTGTTSRETGTYAKPLKNSPDHEREFKGKTSADTSRWGWGHACRDRYFSLNLVSHKPTVEFRVFAGTLNTTKLLGHIKMTLALVEKAIYAKRLADWEGKPGVYFQKRAKTPGLMALRMFYREMGWEARPSERDKYPHFGLIEVEGAPTNVEMMKKLDEMGKKYDGRSHNAGNVA